jgi:hypothetical protein
MSELACSAGMISPEAYRALQRRAAFVLGAIAVTCAVVALLLCGCSPESEGPVSDGTETSDTGTEEGTEESTGGDDASDSWGIKLDVGPPYYSGTGETT